MKVLFLITHLDEMGGAQRHVLDLVRAFSATGLSVDLAFGNVGGSADFSLDPVTSIGISSLKRQISLFSDLFAFKEIRDLIGVREPDVICLHSSKAGVLGRVAAMGTGIPVVFTAHGWAFTEGVSGFKRLVYKQIERVLAELSTRIITVSDYDRSLALRRRVGDEHKVVTVHNGVHDTDEPMADPSINPPQLIMVARFASPKDHSLLLQALVDLQALSWELELVGDGPKRVESQQLVEKLGLASRVRFVGATEGVAERLSRAQIFVLVSQWEGLPLSIIEAMRAGLPVIASDVGGVDELVEEGKTGYLVPRSDVCILAERLRQLLEDPTERAAMGAASRQCYETQFTFDRMFESTFEVYRQAIAQAKNQ